MTLDVLRERTLWAKRQELANTVLSRKRKLRELYAVARSPRESVPDHPNFALDPPPVDDAEASFLDANDLLKGRYFDVSTLPARRSHALSVGSTARQVEGPQPALATAAPATLRQTVTAQDDGVVGRAIVDAREAPTPVAVPEKQPGQTPTIPWPLARPGRPPDASTTEARSDQIPLDEAGNKARSDAGATYLGDVRPPVVAPFNQHRIGVEDREAAPGGYAVRLIAKPSEDPPTKPGPTNNEEARFISVHEPTNGVGPDPRPVHNALSEEQRPDLLSSGVTDLAENGDIGVAALEGEKITDQPNLSSNPPESGPRPADTQDFKKFSASFSARAIDPSILPSNPALEEHSERLGTDERRNASQPGYQHSVDGINATTRQHNGDAGCAPVTQPTRNQPRLDQGFEQTQDTVMKAAADTPTVPLADLSIPKIASSSPAKPEFDTVTSTSSPVLFQHKSTVDAPIKAQEASTISTNIQATAGSAPNSSRLESPLTVSNTNPASLPQSMIHLDDKKHERKDKPSAVTFVTPRSSESASGVDIISNGSDGPSHREPNSDADYMLPLFVAQAYKPPRAQSLSSLLSSAHKTVSTSDLYVDLHEQHLCRILTRINQLQRSNRWSMQQIERSPEPKRSATHWDALLNEMRWMRTDFREERKWKVVSARNMARWCAAWVWSQPRERAALQVRVRRPLRATSIKEKERRLSVIGSQRDVGNLGLPDNRQSIQQTPDLVPSAEDDSMTDGPEEDDDSVDLLAHSSAANIFAMEPDEVTLAVEKNSCNEKILHELPLSDLARSFLRPPDAYLQVPMVPVSKYVRGRISLAEPALSRKGGRYEIDESEVPAKKTKHYHDTTSFSRSSSFPGQSEADRGQLPPELDRVALFNPENKHIRDRIHAGHAFRPPSGYAMPPQSFFECRQSSQWTVDDEDQLRDLVKQYSYNWSLISSLVSTSSLFASGAERRTPWECFERWISLEGLPADMQRTQYFRTYQARIDAGQRNGAPEPQQSQSSQPEGTNPPDSVRRRSTQPIRVERKKQTKHLALIDAMRKLAKKRETSIQKQQQAAGMAAMRKANIDATQPRAPVRTPQDFSRIKYDRELKFQERAEAYRQQVIAHQRSALQRSAPHPGASAAASNGTSQPQRNGTSATDSANNPLVPSSFPGNPNQGAFPNPTRPQPSLQVPPNSVPAYGNGGGASSQGGGMNSSMNMKAVPQAHMHPNIPPQQRLPPPATNDMRLLFENNRIQQEQRRYLQQQQQQGQLQFQGPQSHHPVGPSSSPTMNNGKVSSGQGPAPSNPAMLAAFQAASSVNGMAKPANHNLTVPSGPSSSPHMAQTSALHPTQPQSLSSGMVPAINSITHQIKVRNPNASPEQIKKMTSDQLAAQIAHRMSQSAINAAAGALSSQPMSMSNGSGMIPNHQLYAQMIRAQQATQSKGGIPLPNGIRPPSRSATPQTQRGPNVASNQGQSQSPRPPSAQVAGGQ